MSERSLDKDSGAEDPGAEGSGVVGADALGHLPDSDPEETQEWVESLDGLVEKDSERARLTLMRLLARARSHRLEVSGPTSTDYVNTIGPDQEPQFPGDEHIERRIRAFIRWNAAVMVARANRPEIGVGGHIASYASAASLYEVGFNHFFAGRDNDRSGDQVFIQGHASPGIYARAYLEGHLSQEDLDGFRQEISHPGGGLPSYPHPRMMPDFWEFPSVVMGLSPLTSIYQARFNRYLRDRGITDTEDSHVWAFLGDGETAEPESTGQIELAGREGLDNLTFVINCNLQQLDGPVRGNGKIIQDLEAQFRGAGWNVIKVVWGRDWDPLFAEDVDGVLIDAMNETPDGQFQTYSSESGEYIRKHFFGRDSRLAAMVEDLSDEELELLSRGGHDYRKVYAAFRAAREHVGQPTVILAHTVKGWTLGPDFEARNATHQMKNLSESELKRFRDRLHLPISDADLEEDLPPYYHPGQDSEEMEYMHRRRQELGGYLPRRQADPQPLTLPDDEAYEDLRRGSGSSSIATTMAFVRLLQTLLKDESIGDRFVPIIPDEARTFGMDSLFPKSKIYSPAGMTYDAVDRDKLLSWQESTSGQMLHEGITEAGSMGSAIAAGSSYATHGEPMIPVYVFYSMFGFQHTGSLMWAMADQLARGFLIGATAGRTSLNGEGLQHQDGQSPLLASANPACVHYDPAFGFEIAHIVRDGLQRMYGSTEEHPAGEDVFYYITLYNDPYPQPPEPETDPGQLQRDILRGLYRYQDAPAAVEGSDDGGRARPGAQILASGVAMPWAVEAQRLLAEEWDVAADLWSATSWNELRRDALACDESNRLHPGEEQRVPHVSRALSERGGPVVAVSDFMRAVPDQIAPWVPEDYTSLGTDGFGRSDTRPTLRRHYGVDAQSIVVAVLSLLAARDEVEEDTVQRAIDHYQLGD
ncbi:MAG: pyruvate dehydrogenase (acetyl-transferring), homodimeric type [Nesterenkonia sp.]